MKTVSVVIPTYNQKKYVREAIESLLTQTYSLEKIVVIDNASEDGTFDYLHEIFQKNKRVVIYETKRNTGVVGGRNTGLRHVQGEYVLFFDHDMVAEKTLVEKLVKVAETKEDIGIVTPKIYYWEKKKIIWSAGTDVNLTTGQTLFRGGLDKGQYDTTSEVAVAPAVLLVKRKVIDKIKDFDPVFFATYEDTDFCFRAKKKGFLTYYAPDAVAYHKIPYDQDISSVRLLTRAYWVGRNRIIFMRRYSNRFLIFLLLQPVFFVYYVVLALRYRNFRALGQYTVGVLHGLLGK